MSRVNSSNLASALKKVHRHLRTEWVGYLTPAEIVALVKAGARPQDAMDLSRNEEYVRKGDSSPGWFYFQRGRLPHLDSVSDQRTQDKMRGRL